MPIDRTFMSTWVDDSGSGTDGTVLDVADFTAMLDAIEAAGSATPGITTDGTRVQQIAFATTQLASADANTLDDYEEGSWTPVIGGAGGQSGQTYSHQTGRYIKTGRDVLAVCSVLLSAKGTITSNVQIQGLPFTSDATTNLTAVGTLVYQDLAVAKVACFAYLPPNTAAVVISGNNAAATANSAALQTADIGNTTWFLLTISYLAAN